MSVLSTVYNKILTASASLDGSPVVKYLWFNIWIQLAIIIHLLCVVCVELNCSSSSLALATDQLAIHRFQLAIIGAIAVVFAVYGANFIFSEQGSLIAVGVGWLLLAMVDVGFGQDFLPMAPSLISAHLGNLFDL